MVPAIPKLSFRRYDSRLVYIAKGRLFVLNARPLARTFPPGENRELRISFLEQLSETDLTEELLGLGLAGGILKGSEDIWQSGSKKKNPPAHSRDTSDGGR